MMGIRVEIIISYVVGGVTLLPTILILILVHAYLTSPLRDPAKSIGHPTAANSLKRAKDDETTLLSGQNAATLAEKFRSNHEPDVAAGYFAVCREYVPGGVNGKPPERTTPVGSVISVESPSVYQSMYRSIFERKQAPTLDPGQTNGRTVRRARNVFFVVLRHGHLMLYEDSEQMEVKHVISLEHHDVSIYAGEDRVPEGELWIKRNAIRLTRKLRIDDGTTKPFFLFSDNCSDKEDFYFALLQNQEARSAADDHPSNPLHFEASHIIGLVQRLHSSEEQLQTRWINALIGRLFLAIYKTADTEDFIRTKVTKKIASVKKPAFLSDIVLRKIDLGEGAPQLTNPRLKDLTIDGDCCVEGDISYNGAFRLEIAATARLDLGARFKAREVNLVLAVVIKKLNGHGLLKFKPPPSNRVWVTFEHMPDMELSIEPIVSSRQITYGVILRAIESRIREVIAETVVLPHWDDCPFTSTEQQAYRGGIWAERAPASQSPPEHGKIPDESLEDELDPDVDRIENILHPPSKDERTMSMPVLSSARESPLSQNSPNSPKVRPEDSMDTLPYHAQQKVEKPPRALRSTSFASAADPLLSNANAGSIKRDQNKGKNQQKDATSAMMAISNRSRPTSPNEHITPPSQAAQVSSEANKNAGTHTLTGPRINTSPHQSASNATRPATPESSGPPTPTSVGSRSVESTSDHISAKAAAQQLRSRALKPPNKRQSVAAIGAATAAAKKWGWGVLARNGDPKDSPATLDPDRAGTPRNPIGRGQPLPPPGTPLPTPNGLNTHAATGKAPRRKPLPAPSLSKRPQEADKGRSSSNPPLPARRRQSSLPLENVADDGLLVVQAPISEPPSPAEEVKERLATPDVANENDAPAREADKGLSEKEGDLKERRRPSEERLKSVVSLQIAQGEKLRAKIP